MVFHLDFAKLLLPSRGVFAVWNKSAKGASLGTLLILIAECNLLCSICRANKFDVAVHAPSHGVINLGEAEFRLLQKNDIRDAALSLLEGIEGVGRIFLCADSAAFDRLSSGMPNNYFRWSSSDRLDYDSTKYVNFLSSYVGFNANIMFKPQVRRWARKIHRNYFLNGYPTIGLHLKKISDADLEKSLSSAQQDIWYEFLLLSTKKYKLNFILLGDDPIITEIKLIPNIISAKEVGAINFGLQMAILSECSGFMGMMSAICNMAIFSPLPYAIFKNPEHHKHEMIAELGYGSSYAFANKHQRIIRSHETVDLLDIELKRMPFLMVNY